MGAAAGQDAAERSQNGRHGRPPGGQERASGAKTMAAAHLVEGGTGKDVDLVRHGVDIIALHQRDGEHAAEEQVDEET